MKKLLLFIFILLGFIAKSQELDELYLREKIVLTDSSAIAIATDGDTLATNISVANAIHDSLENVSSVSFGNEYEIPATNATTDDFNYSSGLRYYTDSLVVDSEIRTPKISARFQNLSLYAEDKEIARIYSNGVLEQIIINPQGDLTGTAAAPSLAFGDGNTGLYEAGDNILDAVTSGSFKFRFGNPNRSVDLAPISTNAYDLGTSSLIWEELWINNINNPLDISFNINSIETIQVTEDTTFVKNYLKAEGITISLPDATIALAMANSSSGQTWLNSFSSGTGSGILRLYDGSEVLMVDISSEGDTYFNGGNFGINDGTPTYSLDVNGTGRFTGIVNFDVFPITPSSAPTTDYQVANKKYVDDNTGARSPAGFLHLGSTTQDVVFDALDSFIPSNTDDIIIVGAITVGAAILTLNRALRTSGTLITLYGLNQNGILQTTTVTNGDATTVDDISVSW